MTHHFRSITLGLLLFCVFACSKTQTGDSSHPVAAVSEPAASTAPPTTEQSWQPVLNRIWRVSKSPQGPAAGAIYVFLPNGTLLETSCVETYRIALWSVDKAQPNTLRVVEDQQTVFTATLGESTGNTLHLHQKLLRSPEVHDITLTAVDTEFVCPDLPK